MTRVYKVVTRLYNGRLTSAMTRQYDESLTHDYAVNGTTYPRVGKLFAFDTLENARRFACYSDHYVYAAEAESAHPVTTWMPRIGRRALESLKRWWDGDFSIADQHAPVGTLACDSIRLTGSPL